MRDDESPPMRGVDDQRPVLRSPPNNKSPIWTLLWFSHWFSAPLEELRNIPGIPGN